MKFIFALCLALAASAAAAADAPSRAWKDSAELSFVNANGNVKTQTTSAKDSFSYDFSPIVKLEMEGGGLGARSEGRVIAEQYYALEKVYRKITDRDYVFEKYRWDRNVFAGIAHRHDFSIGAGRELYKTSKDLLIGELAPGYVNEERVSEPRKSYMSARAYTKYTRDFTATAKFSQDAEYVVSLHDARDARLNTETALTAAVSTMFSVKNSFVWKHDARPPLGKRKDDTILSVALLATF
jgi:putative salt-induced outer membrane protein YdiY